MNRLWTISLVEDCRFVAARFRSSRYFASQWIFVTMLSIVLLQWIHLKNQNIAFPLDDAYIILHNAQALLTGDDNFAGAAPLSGSTSLLFTLATALLISFLQGPLALWMLSWLGILAAGTSFARIAQNFGNTPLQQIAIVTGTLLAGQPFLIFLNGIETGWAIAAVGWALALASAPRPTVKLVVVCGLLPFVRPELSALTALLFLNQIRRHLLEKRQLADAILPIKSDLVVLLAIVLPFFAYQWLAAGSLFPNSGPAKLYFFAESQRTLGQNFALALITVSQFLGVLGPVFLAAFLPRTRTGLLGVVFTVIVIGAYTIAAPTILSHNYYRYLYIFVPVLAVNLSAALGAASPAWRKSGLVILALSIAWNLVSLPSAVQEYTSRSSDKLKTMSELVEWMEANLDPRELVLAHDIGYVAYATSQPLNDLVGLKTPENIAMYHASTYRNRHYTRAESIEKIALRSGARILIVSRGWEPHFHIAAGLQRRGWHLTPLSTETSPTGYEIYRIKPPQ